MKHVRARTWALSSMLGSAVMVSAALAGGTISAAAPAPAGRNVAPASGKSCMPAMLAGKGGFLGPFTTVCQIASTVPSLPGRGNGDVNPYGVAVVPRTVGNLWKGDVLVSNFNNLKNQQGTGTTIMEVSPKSHSATVFANLAGQAKGRIGLTTALSVFRSGYVVVGSLPTADGTAATATAGALYVLNSHGKLVETIAGPPSTDRGT